MNAPFMTIILNTIESRKLKGKIPYELGKMPSLKVLILNDNEITGTIPREFG